jgi:hypothetical protein
VATAFVGVIAAVVIPLLPLAITEVGVRDLLKDLLGPLV